MFESRHHGTFGLPPGDRSPELQELADQIERLSRVIDSNEEKVEMMKSIMSSYGPRNLINAWTGMLKEMEKKKQQEKRKENEASGGTEKDL